MTLLALTTRRLAATAALAVAGGVAATASAQFVSVDNYQGQAAPTQQPTVMPQATYVTPPGAVAYAAPQPGGPTYQPAPQYAAPAGQYRVAQTLPTPAPSAEAVAAPVETIAPVTSYSAPMSGSPAAAMHYHGAAPTTMSYGAPSGYASGDCATGDCGTGGCATGDCNQGVSWDSYAHAAPACDYAPTCAPACDLAPAAPRRQWFGGLYSLYLQRVDTDKRLVAFCDDIGGYTVGTPYYYEPGDVALFTDSPGIDGQWGAEVRFGSTFGCPGPCGCMQPYAWEVGYWALNDDSGQTVVPLIGSVGVSGSTNHGLFGTIDYTGLRIDLDGAGTTWTERNANEYTNYGVHETGDIDLYSTRLLGVRVRNNFEVQNLELNFWRFGCPVEVGGVGLGRGLGRAALGAAGPAACGPGCGPAACGRPPRRFFINGLCGVRYLRVDDDLGIAYQFTQIDGGTGDPPAGWPSEYESFPTDDNSVLFHDVQADNQLVGFQLGSSMNWLVGCNWNFFADSNFGVYGNQIDVYQAIYGGGASEVTQRAGGGPAVYRNSETNVAFLGELRAGVAYQISCNCRLTAAYRFIGIGGLALGYDQISTAGYANSELVGHIDNNESLVLHGAQTGVEWKY